MKVSRIWNDSQIHPRLCPLHDRKFHCFDFDIFFSSETCGENDVKHIVFCHVLVSCLDLFMLLEGFQGYKESFSKSNSGRIQKAAE